LRAGGFGGITQKAFPDLKASANTGFFGKLGGKAKPLFGAKSADGDGDEPEGKEGDSKKAKAPVDVSTGEEDETRLMKLDEVSLYVFDPASKRWLDRGRGIMSVNELKSDKTKARLVMRQKGTKVREAPGPVNTTHANPAPARACVQTA